METVGHLTTDKLRCLFCHHQRTRDGARHEHADAGRAHGVGALT